MDAYPPEYDGPDNCLVCQKDISSSASECECPECPVCTEVGDPDCYANGHMEKGNRAFNLRDLADHLGAHNVDGIAKRLFKDTECGISFWTDTIQVLIAGYAEGSGDATCPPHEFGFPIDLDEFDAAVVTADKEGCELFEEFHCSRCGAEVGYEESCDECDKAFRREEK
tara:strand:- start:270 stop:776 length:507 start_codon:yes stop_codon:yes gene_type:complete